MIDLLEQFRAWLPTASSQERLLALKLIEDQTQLMASALEDVAKKLMALKDDKVFRALLERRNLEIEELLTIEHLLKSES